MTLFFSRRTYNASKTKFTNNPAQLTRYVRITDGPDADGTWSGGIISQKDWLDQVHAEAETDEVTIFVHGFNNDQLDMLRRFDKIKTGLRDQGYRGAVVAFDWPSEGNVLAYDNDKRNAKATAQCLVEDGIIPLTTRSNATKINLIAHSMGAYLTLRALSDFGDAASPGSGVWKLNQIMFVSGDADARWFARGAWGSLLLAHRSNRFTNYFSQLDQVLNLPAVIGNGLQKRVGRSGMPQVIDKNHVDVYSHEQYLQDVILQDRTTAFSHQWWFDNDKFYKDAALTIAGEDAQQMPTRRRMNTTDLALLS
ncbi:alpha/beta fold hydrolase [uncultured Roseobacter sp.]|uniref:alpha/beta fold hydrolase n=1 Tax=uncultured Roseobacter sp. TaxID=114847 RepID=UPI00262DB8AC|nr:alpha/beta fold hydrolase [uncultured Roseobacter sp.]